MITGKHLIAGDWIAGDSTFTSEPAHGPASEYAQGTKAHINAAVEFAEQAFWSYGYSTAETRAGFLNAIADEIEARGEALTHIGSRETGLPEARLNGERGRTTGQLRLFASHILDGAYLDRRHDVALPDRAPMPRPDIKMVERPVGPVAVFGASNFPLAFSTAGGDTASALAAGCPVVVKGHPAHPGTAEIVAQAIAAAIKTCGIHSGVFSLIQSNSREAGEALVTHPLIQAVGFTGSLGAGRALFNLCASRPTPIPFFGELGSINPMFLLPHALSARGPQIAQGWAGSLTMGAGQFCTNPGVVVVLKGDDAQGFATAASEALAGVLAQTMLTDGIAASYQSGREAVAASAGVDELLAASCEGRNAAPYLYRVSVKDWLDSRVLAEEVFGPLGIIVEAHDFDEMKAVALNLHGQLTCTLQIDDADLEQAKQLMPILERKAGRILANGFPTGVEVSEAMVHGGPYPASTNFGATSVGTLAIRRFVRPVSYQSMPDALLPLELR